MHISTMEAPESLPDLSDALETLDQQLGFLIDYSCSNRHLEAQKQLNQHRFHSSLQDN